MSSAAFAADREMDGRLNAAPDMLIDMMRASDKGIPHDLFVMAHRVVVVPGMKKAGFIFGAKYGRAVAAAAQSGALRPRCGLKVEVSGFRLRQSLPSAEKQQRQSARLAAMRELRRMP
jgi:hypothetical protein